MMEFSIGDRLLLHLYKYRTVNPAEYYNIPWDLTQDGIAASLRISRAHASIELKKHREKENVEENQVHIRGGKVKRKSYVLTPKGLDAAIKLETAAKEAGIDINTLLDLKRQDPNKLLDNLSDRDRMALGCACIFRTNVPASAIPPHERSVIPCDVNGYTVISNELRTKIMDAADENDLRSWHSYAVQAWMDNSDLQNQSDDTILLEKTYHLLSAGRITEACKLIASDIYRFIYVDDKEFYKILKPIEIPAKYGLEVTIVKTEMAINNKELDSGLKFAELMASFEGGEECSLAYKAKILMLKNRDPEAKFIISQIKESGNVIALLKLADAYIDLNELESAKSILTDVASKISGAYASAGTQRFITLARIAALEGDVSQADLYLIKASGSNAQVDRSYVRALKKELGIL